MAVDDKIPFNTKVPIVLCTETYKLSIWLREKMDLSKYRFNKKVGLTNGALDPYEKKEKPLSVPILQKISKSCKCSFWISGKLVVLVSPPKTQKFLQKYSECFILAYKHSHFLYEHLTEVANCSNISFWVVAGQVGVLGEKATREFREKYIAKKT